MDSIVILIIAAGLGIIPGKIAEKKGHSFWLWWFYGWMIFIVAIIHVQFIEDKNFEVRDKEEQKENRKISAPDQLMKYKQLLDAGAITEQEYETKKRELLNL